MTKDFVEVRRGAYHDSVTLMRVSRALAERDGVTAAQTAMATELNLELIEGLGFAIPEGTGPNDLVVTVRAADDGALAEARTALEALLSEAAAPAEPSGAAPPPHTVGAAAAGSTLALISVPGPYAFVEAMDALTAGLNVMLFSDNVPVEQEIALKDAAARLDLLVMGPDCGTAVVGGVGLGFANAVRPGPVSLVAASGTGTQQILSLLDEAGVGVRHALGVGGRDLSAEVSGRSTLQAMAALDADPDTELILIVSKPPAPQVGELVRSAAARLATPTVFALLGEGRPDLTTAVESVLQTLDRPIPRWRAQLPDVTRPVPAGGELRGFFVGGTLCDEAMLIAAERLGPIRSNIPLRPEWTLDGPGHSMIDFGDDSLTQGRPHPMIDPTLRLERLAALDDACGVVLLDVVLGHGAEPDPAAALAPLIETLKVPVVVSLCGTDADPQNRGRQAEQLWKAGAAVFASNAAAARHAVALIEGNRDV